MAMTVAHQAAAAVMLANPFPSVTARSGSTCHRLSDGLVPPRSVSAAAALPTHRGLRLNSNSYLDMEPSCSNSRSIACGGGASRLRERCQSSLNAILNDIDEGNHHHAADDEDDEDEDEKSLLTVGDVAASSSDVTRRGVLSAGLGLVGLLALSGSSDVALSGRAMADTLDLGDDTWEVVPLPLDPGVVLLDVAFVPGEPLRGYLVGTRQTLLETLDGGKSWEPRSVDTSDEEGFNYRFGSISFNGNEGWIVGKPAILLHTEDAGRTWGRLPLSARLPGNPVVVKGTGKNAAEMVTDEGAIYVTSDKGYYWKAAVEETVSATLNRTVSSGIGGASYYTGTFSNINRSPNGSYVAVSSRGNFFLTWEPGQTYWQPHNRVSSRRIQNIGWRADGGLWLVTRGGGLFLSQGEGVSEDFKETRISSRGFGILDVGFRTLEEGYAAGGSGILLKTTDGGSTWVRDKTADNIAANLYVVRFVNDNSGFVLGNNGVLLRYTGSTAIGSGGGGPPTPTVA